MSLQDVRELAAGLPASLRDQVIGYAESVERALPDIFREARRRPNERIARELVFLAGVKKLHWLASSSYWTLENSGKLLANLDVNAVRIGGSDFSRGGQAYSQLQTLLGDLNEALGDQQISEYLLMSWKELVRALASNERR